MAFNELAQLENYAGPVSLTDQDLLPKEGFAILKPTATEMAASNAALEKAGVLGPVTLTAEQKRPPADQPRDAQSTVSAEISKPTGGVRDGGDREQIERKHELEERHRISDTLERHFSEIDGCDQVLLSVRDNKISREELEYFLKSPESRNLTGEERKDLQSALKDFEKIASAAREGYMLGDPGKISSIDLDIYARGKMGFFDPLQGWTYMDDVTVPGAKFADNDVAKYIKDHPSGPGDFIR